MTILESVESRWFFGPEDGRLRAIADRFASVASEGAREDRYLPTGREDVGIKIRAEASRPAKLETKYRVGELGPVELAPGVVGRCERWRKLSAEVEASSVTPGPGEVALSKDRKLRKYAVDGDGVKEIAPRDLPSAGCNVEWTELRRGGVIVAWTLGLEAFGPSPACLFALLRVTSASFFAGAAGLQLDQEGSMGYAEWVSRYPTERG